MILSILICTLLEREKQFNELISSLHNQLQKAGRIGYVKSQVLHGNYYINRLVYGDVEIIACGDNRSNTIGKKRNILMAEATGEYVCCIDDDDKVSDNYIELLMGGINKGVDCCSLTGIITFDGERPKKFIHYMNCTHYYETTEAYHRFPNHLNCIKASIANQFKFPEKSHGEDTDWATLVKQSGLIKTEHTIEQVIYNYKFVTNKK